VARLRTSYSEETEDSFRCLECAFSVEIDAGLSKVLYT
jgi:hypothetical protein